MPCRQEHARKTGITATHKSRKPLLFSVRNELGQGQLPNDQYALHSNKTFARLSGWRIIWEHCPRIHGVFNSAQTSCSPVARLRAPAGYIAGIDPQP
jgi:hypothetical protein